MDANERIAVALERIAEALDREFPKPRGALTWAEFNAMPDWERPVPSDPEHPDYLFHTHGHHPDYRRVTHGQ